MYGCDTYSFTLSRVQQLLFPPRYSPIFYLILADAACGQMEEIPNNPVAEGGAAVFFKFLKMMLHRKNIGRSMYPHTCEHMCDIYIHTYIHTLCLMSEI